MSSRRGRRPSRLERLARPGLAAFLLALGLLLSVAFVGIAIQNNAVNRDTAVLSAQIAQERIRHAALEAEAAEKATASYVSDKARELGYVQPGEGIIALDTPARANAIPAPEPARADRLGRWMKLFFGPRP